MQLAIELPNNVSGFHAVRVNDLWTMQVSVHVTDGDDYTVRAEGSNFDQTLTNLKTDLANV